MQDYREKRETDVNEVRAEHCECLINDTRWPTVCCCLSVVQVLQTQSIFVNVSKALLAKGDDLRAAFGTDDQLACALIILDKGELEVSDKERAQQYEALFKVRMRRSIAAPCIN